MEYYLLEHNYLLKLNEIITMEAMENYTIFRLTNGANFISSTTLKRHQERLQSFSFYRVNRQMVINKDFIKNISFQGNVYYILLTDGRKIQVSRRRKDCVELLAG
jgi:two-component system LytT family response regulator